MTGKESWTVGIVGAILGPVFGAVVLGQAGIFSGVVFGAAGAGAAVVTYKLIRWLARLGASNE